MKIPLACEKFGKAFTNCVIPSPTLCAVVVEEYFWSLFKIFVSLGVKIVLRGHWFGPILIPRRLTHIQNIYKSVLLAKKGTIFKISPHLITSCIYFIQTHVKEGSTAKKT